MPTPPLDPPETEVAQEAVQALSAAQRLALDSGTSILLIDNDELVRVEARGKTVLKKLPPRRKVTERTKRASP